MGFRLKFVDIAEPFDAFSAPQPDMPEDIYETSDQAKAAVDAYLKTFTAWGWDEEYQCWWGRGDVPPDMHYLTTFEIVSD